MPLFPRVAAITLVASAIVALSATPAYADPTVDGATLTALAQLNPGASEEDMLRVVVDAAARRGVSPAAFAESSLAEAQVSIASSLDLQGGLPVNLEAGGSSFAAASLAARIRPRTTGATTQAAGEKLGTSQRKGDIFTAPATTLWIQHGHTGIYYTTSTIIEAPGIGQVVKKTAASSIYVDPGAHKMSIDTTQSNRNAAADWAASKLGYGYNLFFADNKNVEDDVYNCSQLVWAAYMKNAGLDLDANGGASVFPVDIRDSRFATSYKSF